MTTLEIKASVLAKYIESGITHGEAFTLHAFQTTRDFIRDEEQFVRFRSRQSVRRILEKAWIGAAQ